MQTEGSSINRQSNLQWLLAIVAAIATVTGLAAPASADDFTPSPGERARYVEYERQLNAILKTRLDEEKMFVAEVVDQVRLGKIPSKLVNTSFDWVLKKRPNTNYPFVYFERVLRLQADRLGIEDEVPEFDYDVYRTSAGQSQPSARGLAGQWTEFRRKLRVTPGIRRLFPDD